MLGPIGKGCLPSLRTSDLTPFGARQDRAECGLGDALRIAKDVGLPEAQHRPAELLERPSFLSIALNIGFDLGDPIRSVGTSGELGFARPPVAAVPEIAVAEDDDASFGDDDVGLAGQPGIVKTVANSQFPERTSKEHFGSGVAAAVPFLDVRSKAGRRLEIGVAGYFRGLASGHCIAIMSQVDLA